MTSDGQASPAQPQSDIGVPALPAPRVRLFGWAMLACLLVYLINNYLTLWLDFPGTSKAIKGEPLPFAWAQLALYGIAVLWAWVHVRRTSHVSLRSDAETISAINAYFIRGAFWAVLLVGLTDAVVSFLRVEGLLGQVVGTELERELGKSEFRGSYLLWPIVALSFVIAAFTRTLGFHWLALLVVLAELLIVITRFVFSYEQAFMADLVRFWYAALFLFASAHTLIDEGHVRVDVFYASFSTRTKGVVNAVGSVLLGMSLCWVIIAIGMGGKSNVINSPLLAFEVTQAGFGLYVKYFMAGFLGVFAVSMLIQFISYFFEAVADMRDEPGRREVEAPAAH